MTWTASSGTWLSGTTSFTLAPHATGNLVVAFVENNSAAVWATSMTSTNATWVLAGSTFIGTNNSRTMSVFLGTTSSTSSATVTANFNGTPGSAHVVAMEYHSSVGSWSFDTQGNLDSAGGTNTWPGPTAAGSGELGVGYGVDSGSAVAPTPNPDANGWNYNANADGSGNGGAYNLAYSGAHSPVWGDSTQIFAVVILVKEGAAVSFSPYAHAVFPPSYLIRHYRNNRSRLPRQPAFPPPVNIYSETLTGLTGIPPGISGLLGSPTGSIGMTGGVTRSIGRLAVAMTAISAVISAVKNSGVHAITVAAGIVATVASQNNINRLLAAAVAVYGSAVRQVGRIISAASAVTGSAKLAISRFLTTVMAFTVNFSTVKVKLLNLLSQVAVASAVSRVTGKPLAAAQAVTGNVSRKVASTLVALTAVTSVLSTVKVKLLTLISQAALQSSVLRSAGKPLTSVTAATVNIVNRTGKNISGTTVTTGVVSRGITRVLTGAAAIPGALSVIKVKLLSLTTVTAITGSMQRGAGKIIQGPVTVAANITRNLGKIIAASAAVTVSVFRGYGRVFAAAVAALVNVATQAGVRGITLVAEAAVNSVIVRKVSPVLQTWAIMSSGTIRAIFRSIQGNLISAGQTTRTIARVLTGNIAGTVAFSYIKVRIISVSTFVSTTGSLSRGVKVTQSATVIVADTVTRFIRVKIPGYISAAGSVISGRPHLVTLTASIATTGTAAAQFISSSVVLVFKAGLLAVHWVTGQVTRRWKTGSLCLTSSGLQDHRFPSGKTTL